MTRELILLPLILLLVSSGAVAAEENETLTVFAAASLHGAFEEIGGIYENETGMSVAYNFDGSQALATQIKNGAYADVLATANQKQMNSVMDAGLIDNESVTIFAKNKLSLIIPVDNPAQIKNLTDLAKPGVKIVIGARDVPVGDYARRIIEKLGNDSAYGENYTSNVLANVISEETNVNYVVTKVALGEADVGFAYISDVSGDLADRIGRIEIPDEYNVIGEYPIAVMEESTHPDESQRFVELVSSDEGRAVLERHGFLPV